MTPVFYSFRRCPYAMRARLALAISAQPVELREVKLAAKPVELLALNPKGTVPALDLGDGTKLTESLDIMRWALGRADPEGWLARADMELIARNDGAFKHHLDRYKYPERHQSDFLAHRACGVDFLEVLEDRLAVYGQLSGLERGLTDMAIMPFVRQFAATDPAWFATLPLPFVQAWLQGHLQSDLFARVMGRYAPWQAGDAPLMFPH